MKKFLFNTHPDPVMRAPPKKKIFMKYFNLKVKEHIKQYKYYLDWNFPNHHVFFLLLFYSNC